MRGRGPHIEKVNGDYAAVGTSNGRALYKRATAPFYLAYVPNPETEGPRSTYLRDYTWAVTYGNATNVLADYANSGADA